MSALRAALTAIGLIAAFALPPAPTAAQTAPIVRNAGDFAAIQREYRRLRAGDQANCCGFTATIFGRTVSFWLFDRFEPVYEAQNDRQFILEFVPERESVDDWSRMITLSGFRGTGAAPLSTREINARFFGTIESCQQPAFSRIIDSGRLADGTDYILSSNGCGSTSAGSYPGARSGRGEQFIALLLRDTDNVHVLQYAERGEGFAVGREPIPDDAAKAMIGRFRTIGFCRNKTPADDCSIAFAAP